MKQTSYKQVYIEKIIREWFGFFFECVCDIDGFKNYIKYIQI